MKREQFDKLFSIANDQFNRLDDFQYDNEEQKRTKRQLRNEAFVDLALGILNRDDLTKQDVLAVLRMFNCLCQGADKLNLMLTFGVELPMNLRIN